MVCSENKSSGATTLQGLGRQSGRRRSAKLVPTFADRGVSRGQHNESPRPLMCSENMTLIISGGNRNFSALNFPMLSPLVLLVKLRWKQ